MEHGRSRTMPLRDHFRSPLDDITAMQRVVFVMKDDKIHKAP